MNKFGGDTNKLGETEKFFLHLCDIERLQQKYQCLYLSLTSESKVQDINAHISSMTNGCNLLRNNTKFHHILNIILEVGNKLNGISSMRKIKGFSILSLQNFVNTKSFKGNITLLHYIAKLINDTKPELFDCITELSPLQDISKLSIDLIYSEQKEYNESKEVIKREYNYWEGRNADLAVKLDTMYQKLQLSSKEIQNNVYY